VEALPDLPEREVWLVTPPIGVSTAEAFDRLDLPPGERLRSPESGLVAIGSDWTSVLAGRNDLEATVLADFPMIRDVYNVVVEAGASVVRLSGTGATIFACFGPDGGIFDSRGRFPPGTRVIRTRTLTRSSICSQRVVQ
jgi:4-diphosphocytidyl-2-C-methyl-D-erythritol kinase